MMKFENEDHLQEFIHSVIGGTREVEMPDGSRVDVLTSYAVIEVKPKLTRSALLQAMAQAQIYGSHHPGKRMVVAGCTPSDEEASYATADRVRAQGVEVWYVDQMREFQDAWRGAEAVEYETPVAGFWQTLLSWALAHPVWAGLVVISLFLLHSAEQQQPSYSSRSFRQDSYEVSTADAVVRQQNYATPLYALPSDDSRIVRRLETGADVWITGCSGEFVAVSVDGIDGWVRAEQVSGHSCGG